MSSPIERVPPELLRMILKFTTPPPSLLDPSLVYGRNSSWCYALRTQKSIVSVCKLWWALGSEMLYRDVVFRRIGQMAAFVRTMDESEEDCTRTIQLRNFVKSASFVFYVPFDYTHYLHTHLDIIADLCPKLSSVRYDPTHTAEPPTQDDLVIAACSNRVSTITHLDLGEAFYFSIGARRLLSGMIQLESLSFHLPDSNNKSFHEEGAKLTFESLKVLRCAVKIHESESALVALASTWSMPRLQSFSLHFINTRHSVEIGRTLRFFRRYGPQLRTLQLSCRESFPLQLDVHSIILACPNVEHLVLGPNISATDNGVVGQAIRWIDIFLPADADRIDGEIVNEEQLFDKEKLPSLSKVRFIDEALCHMPDLPFILHPDVVGGKEVVHHSFYGLAIEETHDALKVKNTHVQDGFRLLGVSDDSEASGDSNSDSDYEFDSEDDYDPYFTEEEVPGWDDLSHEDYALPSENEFEMDDDESRARSDIDVDTVLTLFEQTLQVGTEDPPWEAYNAGHCC